jgi:hypothetical protein
VLTKLNFKALLLRMDTHLDTVLEAEELPAGIAYLNSRLTNVDGQALSHIDTKLKIMLNSDL